MPSGGWYSGTNFNGNQTSGANCSRHRFIPASPSTLLTPLKRYFYDAAISFSGKDWEYADELYRRLSSCGMKVYYYRSKQAMGEPATPKLAYEGDERGRQIVEEIREVYGKQALFFIPILSKAYSRSTHGNREWALSMISGYEHMVPLRLGKVASPAMIGQVPAYDVGGETPKYNFDDIVERVSRRLLAFPAQEWEKRKVTPAR